MKKGVWCNLHTTKRLAGILREWCHLGRWALELVAGSLCILKWQYQIRDVVEPKPSLYFCCCGHFVCSFSNHLSGWEKGCLGFHFYKSPVYTSIYCPLSWSYFVLDHQAKLLATAYESNPYFWAYPVMTKTANIPFSFLSFFKKNMFLLISERKR